MSYQQKTSKLKNLASLSTTLFLALTIRWGLVEAYEVPTGSMLPSIMIHDHILVNKWVYGLRIPFTDKWLSHFKQPERGEVVVIKDPRDTGTFLIKRIIGVPGDVISYHDNQLFVNNELVESFRTEDAPLLEEIRDQDLENRKEDHQLFTENLNHHPHSVLHSETHLERTTEDLEVPEGAMFMMGDHRDNSADSRYWGFAPENNILGRASFVWLSCKDGWMVRNGFRMRSHQHSMGPVFPFY